MSTGSRFRLQLIHCMAFQDMYTIGAEITNHFFLWYIRMCIVQLNIEGKCRRIAPKRCNLVKNIGVLVRVYNVATGCFKGTKLLIILWGNDSRALFPKTWKETDYGIVLPLSWILERPIDLSRRRPVQVKCVAVFGGRTIRTVSNADRWPSFRPHRWSNQTQSSSIALFA